MTAQVETRGFISEALTGLADKGFVVYQVSRTFAELHQDGVPFVPSAWARGPLMRRFMDASSVRSEVAVDPSQLVLADSNNKTYTEQTGQAREYAQSLGIDDVDGALVSAADVVALNHGLQLEGEGSIFDALAELGEHAAIRTDTYLDGVLADHWLATVKNSPESGMLEIGEYVSDDTGANLWALGVVVPSQR